MKYIAAVVSILALSACSEQIEESYPTWAEAQRAGTIERGWVPSFVPTSARNISDSHNLDRNTQTLRFAVPPSDVSAIVGKFAHISTDDQGAADNLARELGILGEPEAFIVCSNIQDGVLIVDREAGQAVYDTTIRWTDDDCRRRVTHEEQTSAR
ncbi:YbbD family protein [Pelagerythrobacter marinus]|uniref:hypothetical protein n=1 Tax=Pelagerythrobacter marinus TaxID=538382 RepID=UPI002036DBF8|nr:hypothetical protein [Pelagerythrobacter marinus]USA38258.1 hypothetical protein NCF86_07870 [Pelagerythrobacter marinus]WPZ07780.1 hypothetical protein T8T98_04480 [Pelagerythrobacter marinus]